MCRLPAFSRSTLPEPVTLNRFVLPLCDLFFGMFVLIVV
jgi:hypothetical protein